MPMSARPASRTGVPASSCRTSPSCCASATAERGLAADGAIALGLSSTQLLKTIKPAPASTSAMAAAIAHPAPASHQRTPNTASAGDTAKSTRTGCCLITSRALVARIRSMSLSAMNSECHLAPTVQANRRTGLARGRFGRGELPVVRIFRGIHHRMQLAHRRPLVNVDHHPPVDGVLTHGGSVDDAGEGDILLAADVRSRAHSGHQQRATEELTTRAARDEPLGKKYPQDGDEQEQQTEFPHAAMVGPRRRRSRANGPRTLLPHPDSP